jgi:prepilin-type N-terminal cleavage/methylation domain-containing protein
MENIMQNRDEERQGFFNMLTKVKRNKAFTLIELLVVVAIIALLLSIITPALNQVKEKAKRISCATRLKNYGIAIFAYNVANDDRIMKMVRRWDDDPYIPIPCYVSTVEDYGDPDLLEPGAEDGEWNAYSINPYIEIMNRNYADNGFVTEMVTCPNCSGDWMQVWIGENNWADGYGFDFMEIAYAYWAGADELITTGSGKEASENAKKYLTGDIVSSKKLLMSETLWLTGDDVGEMGYRYNHGRKGWSWNGYTAGAHCDMSPFPQATGRSQLFGDGRVAWKVIPFKDNLPTAEDVWFDVNNGMWNGIDSGCVGDPFDMAYF